jgi:HTH-type transcriptional regulator/antitoxin HigA
MKQMTLTTEEDYIKASKRLMEIFQANPNTQEGKELVELIALIKEYDEKNYKNE